MTGTLRRDAATPPTTSEPRPPLVDGWTIAIVALGAIQPLANYLRANAPKLVWPSTVIADTVIWVVVNLAAFVGVRLLTRRSRPLPIAAAFVVFNYAFWNFFRWFDYEPESEARKWMALLIWTVATALAMRVAMLLAGLPNVKFFLVIFLGVWTASLLVGAVQRRSEVAAGDQLVVPAAPGIEFGADRPDVYWFVLDEHARSDQLKIHTGSDNAWFSDDLADEGFSVSESSTSSYLQTHLSITSTLAMDDIWTPGHDYRGEYALAAPIFRGENPVVETFEDNGYHVVGAPDGRIEWAQCPEPAPTRSCIEPEGGPLALREPHSYLAWSTPIGSLGLPLTHNDPGSVQAGIDQIDTGDAPFFLFSHILSPHYPYRYETDCSLRSRWLDGYNFTSEEHAAAYANEVQCLDHEVVAMVRHIVAQDPDAVIIVQSDHGSRIDFNPDLPLDQQTPELLQERFAALNAIRLPAACRDESIEGQPLTNTFRIVFACLSGQEPDLQEARHFYPESGGTTSFVQVDDATLGGS